MGAANPGLTYGTTIRWIDSASSAPTSAVTGRRAYTSRGTHATTVSTSSIGPGNSSCPRRTNTVASIEIRTMPRNAACAQTGRAGRPAWAETGAGASGDSTCGSACMLLLADPCPVRSRDASTSSGRSLAGEALCPLRVGPVATSDERHQCRHERQTVDEGIDQDCDRHGTTVTTAICWPASTGAAATAATSRPSESPTAEGCLDPCWVACLLYTSDAADE